MHRGKYAIKTLSMGITLATYSNDYLLIIVWLQTHKQYGYLPVTLNDKSAFKVWASEGSPKSYLKIVGDNTVRIPI